ncbi:MAG TPA: ABC transporter permease [Actinophytocola sp.]|nr:ABC transporter permease [Actinophytocola sp.]
MTETRAIEGRSIEGRGPWRLAWERLRRDRVALGAAVVIVVIVVLALAAPLIADWFGHGPAQQFRKEGTTEFGLPVGPSGEFWFGTDNLGRDLLVRTLYGARVSLLVGVAATLCATVIGVVVGMTAGYFGGKVDSVLSRAMDVVLSMPYLLLALVLVAVFGPSLPLTIFVIAFFTWASIARVVRGQTLSAREREYVEAARSLGASDRRIMFVDILPNIVAPVIVLATVLIPLAIVFESVLSFLGLGIVPPTPSWGSMLSEAIAFYRVAWWYLIAPGGALLLTTLAFNLLGDGVRDALDPRAERLFATRRNRRRRSLRRRSGGGR